jgi:DegV family protein with EDD domain
MTTNTHRSAIRIVTDSAARLPADWAREHGVIVLPHYVVMNGHTYQEDVDLSESELAQLTLSPGAPFTVHPPTVEDFSRVYRELADAKADVISLHVSSGLSATIANATQAKQEYRGRCSIQIIDSRSMALGLNELVHAAVALIDRGFSADEIVKQLRGLMQHIYGIFISDDMRFLEHSKRLRPAQAVLGRMLEIIPCLSLEEGDLVAVEKVRSSERAIEKVTEFAAEFDEAATLAVLQVSPQPTERTRALIDSLKLAFPDMKDVPVRTCGAIVGSIIGPSGVGVMIYEGRI